MVTGISCCIFKSNEFNSSIVIFLGPIGIIAADSMLGEITPKMAEAVGQSRARKILVPVNRCFEVAGVQEMSLSQYVAQAVDLIFRA